MVGSANTNGGVGTAAVEGPAATVPAGEEVEERDRVGETSAGSVGVGAEVEAAPGEAKAAAPAELDSECRYFAFLLLFLSRVFLVLFPKKNIKRSENDWSQEGSCNGEGGFGSGLVPPTAAQSSLARSSW